MLGGGKVPSYLTPLLGADEETISRSGDIKYICIDLTHDNLFLPSELNVDLLLINIYTDSYCGHVTIYYKIMYIVDPSHAIPQKIWFKLKESLEYHLKTPLLYENVQVPFQIESAFYCFIYMMRSYNLYMIDLFLPQFGKVVKSCDNNRVIGGPIILNDQHPQYLIYLNTVMTTSTIYASVFDLLIIKEHGFRITQL